MSEAIRDGNYVPVALGVSSTDDTVTLPFKIDSSNGKLLVETTGDGDVVGPASSTDNAIVRFEGTTGKIIQNSAVTIDDTTGAINLLSDSTAIRLGAFSDTILVRDAANTLAIRNGASVQQLNLYRTFTDTSNYERIEFVPGTTNDIRSANAGTGSYRGIQLTGVSITLASGATGGAATGRWRVDSSGNFIAVADNSYDIGASGATRPRSIYAGTDINASGALNAGGAVSAGSASAFRWSASSRILSPSDGVIRLTNDASSDFSRLQFGGTTSSFPAIKRSSAVLAFRLADDSADAGFSASTAVLSGKTTTYNNVATAGWGVPAIYSASSVTGQTARSVAVASYTVGAADGDFEVSGQVTVSASVTHSFSLDVEYTDAETNTARTLILPMAQLAGAFVTGGLITNVTGVGPYESPTMHIRAKTATTITIRPSNGTFTSVTYGASGAIRQLQ